MLQMMTRKNVMSWSKGFIVISGFFLASCAHDSYQQRADLLKDHSEVFYTHLKANRVESAIRENEQIEAMANEMGATVR